MAIVACEATPESLIENHGVDSTCHALAPAFVGKVCRLDLSVAGRPGMFE